MLEQVLPNNSNIGENHSCGSGVCHGLIMQIRVGYELIYDCPQPTPMILTLHIHVTRVSDIIVPDHLITRPSIPITA